MDNPDVVVIGAGVAGGAMSTVLAREGLQVLTLEVTNEHRDVLRGEFFAPWGVAEAQQLGLYDLYMQRAGGHHPSRAVFFDEDMPVEAAEAGAIDTTALPFPPPLCLGHPRMCTVLDEAAADAGAEVLRGVRRTRVTPGERPSVSFEHGGAAHEVRPRLVIGADGRNGPTRQQAGVELHADPPRFWIGGMLVDGVEAWPEDTMTIGTEGWRHLLVFPQGQGRARLYVCVAEDMRAHIIGAEAPRNILDAYKVKSMPYAEAIVAGRPASEPFAYPNNDTWTDEPFTEGVALVGDAAGHNDPVIGQGLSIAHRDVAMVSRILTSQNDWSAGAFAPYAEERARRMQRLRTAARFTATREAQFGPEARERRGRIARRLQERPELMNVMIVPFLGPDVLPPECYAEETIDALLN
jgi:2-polyprenyl-6-methoxyphenol hydroxylase-like FAD-dependent oxidoreductase